MTVCKQCKRGYYQTMTGKSECKECPAGHFCQVHIPQTPYFHVLMFSSYFLLHCTVFFQTLNLIYYIIFM